MAEQSPVDGWAVIIRGFTAPEEDEVAAVFAHRTDAVGYAAWWNREETVRFGTKSPLRAEVEEIDLYPSGGWQPPESRTPRCLVPCTSRP